MCFPIALEPTSRPQSATPLRVHARPARCLRCRQAGIVNFEPLRPYFMEVYQGSQAVLPCLPGLPSLVTAVDRAWASDAAKQEPSAPALVRQAASCLAACTVPERLRSFDPTRLAAAGVSVWHRLTACCPAPACRPPHALHLLVPQWPHHTQQPALWTYPLLCPFRCTAWACWRSS